jgi:hypothetical protein
VTQFKARTDVVASSIYSFNVGGQFDMTLDLLHQFEHDVFTIDAVDLGPRVIVIQGRVGSGSDDDTERRLVALDVHTRTQFLLSSFTHVPFETDDVGPSCLRTPSRPIDIQHLRHRYY